VDIDGDWYPIPVIDPTLRKVNALAKLSQQGCQVPPLIWATTFFPAVAAAFGSYFELTQMSVIKGKIGRPGVHTIRGVFPKLPSFEPSFKSGVNKFLWEVTGKWDKYTNFVFIGELGLQVAFEWTTIAFATAGCLGNPKTARYECTHYFEAPGDGGQHTMYCPQKIYDVDGIAGNACVFDIPAGTHGVISYAFNFTSYAGNTPVTDWQLELINDIGERISLYDHSYMTEANAVQHPIVLKHNAHSIYTLLVSSTQTGGVRATGFITYELFPFPI